MADPTTTLDLTNVQPLLPLGSTGRALWNRIAADPPFWLTEADVPMLEALAVMAEKVAEAASMVTGPGPFATLIKEYRSICDQLGMTPTSRSRLKLTEAQAVTAARRAQAIGGDDRALAIDLDDLVADGG